MPETSDRKEAQVRKVIGRWADSVCRGDLEGIVAGHASDIVMYDVPEPIQCEGLSAYRSTWELFLAHNPPGPNCFSIVGLRVDVSNDMAVAYGLLSINGRPASCRVTIGLRRERSAWVIFHEHHSMPIRL